MPDRPQSVETRVSGHPQAASSVSQSLMALKTTATGVMLAPPEGKERRSQAALHAEGQGPPLVPRVLGKVVHGPEGPRQLLAQHALQAGLQLQAVTGSMLKLKYGIRKETGCMQRELGTHQNPRAGQLRRCKLALVVSTCSAVRIRGQAWRENSGRSLPFLTGYSCASCGCCASGERLQPGGGRCATAVQPAPSLTPCTRRDSC